MEKKKIVIEVTEKELENVFNRDMKLLKRFLKENNVYARIINYICPHGLKEKSLYEKVRAHVYLPDYYLYDFRDVLRLRGTIDPSYTELGHDYWEKYISSVSDKFIEYYEENVSEDLLHYNIKTH